MGGGAFTLSKFQEWYVKLRKGSKKRPLSVARVKGFSFCPLILDLLRLLNALKSPPCLLS